MAQDSNNAGNLPALRSGRPATPGLTTHLVEEQWLNIRAGRGLEASALIDRIGALNRSRFLPVIERVLDEFDRANQVIRLDRLDLDLGRFEADQLGRAEQRLESELRAALRAALGDGVPWPVSDASPTVLPTTIPAGIAVVEAFEHYLSHGIWPYRAGIASGADPAGVLASLLEREPLALVAMLRRRGAGHSLLRRLVLQIPEQGLQALLHRLEPAHATYVIAYLDEVRESHRIEPVVPASPPELDAMLWTIVLRDALGRAGLRANRKAFLHRLLVELAESSGTELAALVAQLRRGAVANPAWRNEGGSVVELLAEIVAEDANLVADPQLLVELAQWLRKGAQGASWRRRDARLLVGRVLAGQRVELRWLLERLAREDAAGLARHMTGFLRLDDALAVLTGETADVVGKATGLARSTAEEAALLKLAAGQGPQPWSLPAAVDEIGRLRGGERVDLPLGTGTAGKDRPARLRGGGVESLSRLIEASPGAGQNDDLLHVLAALQPGEQAAARALLRGLAVADAPRLRRRFEGLAPTELLRKLLPPHLAEPLIDFAGSRHFGDPDWDRLIALAGEADETWLVHPLLAEAADRIGVAGPARQELRDFGTTARQSLALRQLEIVWQQRVPLSPSQRAEAMSRLLPGLSGLPPPVLRARIQAAGGIGAGTELVEQLATPALYRFAALLVWPDARDGLRRRLREGRSSARPKLLAALIEGHPLPATEVRADTGYRLSAGLGDALDRLAAGLSAGGLDRLIIAFGGRRPLPVSREERERVLLTLVARTAERSGPKAVSAPSIAILLRSISSAGLGGKAWIEGILDDLDLADLEHVLGWLAPVRTGARAVQSAAGEAITDRSGRIRREILGLVRAGSTALDRRDSGRYGPMAERRWAALVRARPLGALELLAKDEDESYAGEVAALIGDEGHVALLFAGLSERERERATDIGRLLTGRVGRSVVAGSKVAKALARAASEREWRSGASGFADRWILALLESASLAEQAALRLLLGDHVALPGRAKVRRGRPVLAPTVAPPTAGPKKSRSRESVARVSELIGMSSAAARSEARKLVGDEASRARIVRELGEAQLQRLLALIAPSAAAELIRAAERIAAARQLAGFGLDRAAFWRALIASAVEEPRDIARLLRRMMGGPDGIPFVPFAAQARLGDSLRAMLDRRADAPLLAAVDRQLKPPSRPAGEKARRDGTDSTAIPVGNAGLVLASAFLPRLFETLNYVAPDASGRLAWVDEAVRERSVHLLQWLVDSRVDAPEPALVLNKLLCGLDPAYPVPPSIDPTEAELSTCQALLNAILANWPPLRSSSVEALRETFLQRDGRLTRSESGWKLEVEHKVLDILIDQLPWGFSTLLHPWMPESIVVQWR